MSEEIENSSTPRPSPVDVKPQIPANLGKFVLEPLNYGLAAGCRKALEIGVPSHEMIEFLLNHLCSIVAMVEPSGAREMVIKDIVRQLAPMVHKHVDARYTTNGGVKLPHR